ncbi:MAG: uroporphyrinogen-III synthase [Methylococcaceae bacterium]
MLNGAHILVTRPAHQAENLSRLIAEQGGVAVRLPTLDIVPSENTPEIRKTLAELDRFQWVVFISANAVNFALKANGGKIGQLKPVCFAAIGQTTAQSLKSAGLAVDLVPEAGYSTEALLDMLEMQQIAGQRFLIVRGEGGREELANSLRNRGAKVDYLTVYKRQLPIVDSAQVVFLLAQNKLDIITITSGEALQNLLIMLTEDNHKLLFKLPLVVVSDRIGQIAADIGFKRIAVTNGPSDTAVLEAVTMCLMGK